MFAGGEKIQINALPSQLFDFVRSEKSDEGAKITDEEVASLRAVVDGYQNGKLYVSSRMKDDLEMKAIERINAILKERTAASSNNVYRAYSQDLNEDRERLEVGTTVLAVGAGLEVLGVVIFISAPPVGAFAFLGGIASSITGGVAVHSDSMNSRGYFPATISKPDDNDDIPLPFPL